MSHKNEKVTPLLVAICALKTIAFQGFPSISELANKALARIEELQKEQEES